MTLPHGPLPSVPSSPDLYDEVRGGARRRRRRRTAATGAVGLVAGALVVVALVPPGTVLEADDSLVASPEPTATATATATPDPAASTAGRPSDAELVRLTPGCAPGGCRVTGRVDLAVGTVAVLETSPRVTGGQVRYVLVRGDRLIDALPQGTAWALEYPSRLAADPAAPRNVLAHVRGGATAWWVHAFRPTTTSLGLLSGSIDDPDFYGDGRTELLDAGGFEVGAHRAQEQEEVRVARYGWNGRAYVRTACDHQSGGDGKDEYLC